MISKIFNLYNASAVLQKNIQIYNKHNIVKNELAVIKGSVELDSLLPGNSSRC